MNEIDLNFIFRYSVMESKKIMWEIDIIGDEERIDTNKDDIQLAVNQTIEEYEEQAWMKRILSILAKEKIGWVTAEFEPPLTFKASRTRAN